MPQVDLKILTRPTLSRAYLKTIPDVRGYSHVKMALGGDDSATCTLSLPYGAARDFLANFLGCRVEFYVNNPAVPIWEGYIHRMTLGSGELQITRSFDEMFNRATATYDMDGTGTQQQTIVNNTASQATYGVKYGSIDGGVNYHASFTAHKRALRQLLINIKSWPATSTVFAGRAGDTGQITIECKGIQYFAFDWIDYNDSTSTTQANVTTIITGTLLPLASNTNAPLVINTSDISLIVSNAGFNYPLKNTSGQSLWQQFLSIVEAGDEVSRWVIGVTPYDRRAGYHRFYHRPANTLVNYLMYTGRDYQVFDVTGRRIHPWEMRPDYGLRIVDDFAPPTLQNIAIGAGDNPNLNYLKAVRYDADANIVTWQSDDDMTTEGAMQLNTIHQIVNKKIRPSLRQRG